MEFNPIMGLKNLKFFKISNNKMVEKVLFIFVFKQKFHLKTIRVQRIASTVKFSGNQKNIDSKSKTELKLKDFEFENNSLKNLEKIYSQKIRSKKFF